MLSKGRTDGKRTSFDDHELTIKYLPTIHKVAIEQVCIVWRWKAVQIKNGQQVIQLK
jgi:hypothetical protein